MTRDAQCQWHSGIDNGIDRLGDIGREDLRSGNFLISPMCSKPYFTKWTFLREDDLGVEHVRMGEIFYLQGVIFSPVKSQTKM